MPSQRRRQLLALTTSVLGVTVSGCLSAEEDGNNSVSTTASDLDTSETDRTSETSMTATDERVTTSGRHVEDGSVVPAPTCQDDYRSIEPWWVVESYGPLAGFNLTVDTQSLAVGETLTATLTNISAESKGTGHKGKFDIQYRSEDGWHTILGREDVWAGWSDVGLTHEPGEIFVWELPFTQDGISGAVDHPPTYHVCHPIREGDYRFVYWGIVTDAEVESDYETDYAVAAPFRIP